MNVVLCLKHLPQTFSPVSDFVTTSYLLLESIQMFLSSSYRANVSISAPSLSKYPLVLLSGPDTVSVITRRYCAIFHYTHVVWHWCCLCGICFSCVFEKEKENLPLHHRRVRRDHNTQKSYDLLKAKGTKQRRFFCSWLIHHLMWYSRFFSLQSLKEIRAGSGHSQPTCIH
jgi:hypothetical protein